MRSTTIALGSYFARAQVCPTTLVPDHSSERVGVHCYAGAFEHNCGRVHLRPSARALGQPCGRAQLLSRRIAHACSRHTVCSSSLAHLFPTTLAPHHTCSPPRLHSTTRARRRACAPPPVGPCPLPLGHQCAWRTLAFNSNCSPPRFHSTTSLPP